MSRCLTLFSSLVWVVNSRFLLHFRHMTKVVWVAVAWACGFLLFFGAFQLLGVNDTLGFVISLLASVVCGTFTSVGNSTIVGFMKAIPPENVLGWSSGTGIAGITGSGVYLLLKTLGLDFDSVATADQMCLLLTPLTLLYAFNFRQILNLKARVDRSLEKAQGQGQAEPSAEQQRLHQQQTEQREAQVNEQLSRKSIANVLRVVGVPIYNMSLVVSTHQVYFLEYACTTSFAERANPKPADAPDFLRKNAFVLLSLCYQVGVFVSRSSFYFFKVRRVWILSYLQAANFCLYFSVAYWKWLSYVTLESHQLSKSQKEVAINVASFFNDVGILSASLFAVLVSNFVIPNK